ncbi:MAG: hypothetical protein RL042_1818 [Nitrospirota bacterium]
MPLCAAVYAQRVNRQAGDTITPSSLVAFQAFASVSSIRMELSHLSPDQLKDLVRGIVDDRLRELLGDPDLGLQLDDGLRARLKESLSSAQRLSGEDIADQLGLRW